MGNDYEARTGNEIVLDAAILRRIAEAASGIRGKDLYFIVRRSPVDPWSDFAFEIVDRNPGDVADAMVIKCRTAYTIPEKPVKKVVLTTDSDSVSENLADLADAIFWSESAVEKFAVPYYASVGGDMADWRIADLLSTFGQDKVAALVHLPKSDYASAAVNSARLRRGTLEDFFGVIPNMEGMGGTVNVVPLWEYLQGPQR